ncbi:MAG: hypothetical protein ABIZ04_26505 [Opitutus sp.]
MRFSPAELSVRMGDRTEFRNTDPVPHTATSSSGDPFDSGPLETGSSWSYTSVHAGSIAYHCTFHPTMTGVIEVKP